jgi:cation diffusion facilitator CzcD-associated flavoprotein CzcO
MPDSFPDYPRHDLVLGYLRAYAERHDLRRHVRFGTSVEEAAPREGGWLLRLSSGESCHYGGLIAAVGNEWRPALPDLAGGFAGELVHSSAYRSPEQLRGRRVLVIGAGNSGCDVAVEAATHAAEAAISVRRGYHFVPKHILGRPADVFAAASPPLPAWAEQRVFEWLLRLLLGDLRRYGLPAPDHRIFETHPILNTQLLDRLSHGDLQACPDVSRLDGRRVFFVDGISREVDLIVCATGYRHGVPFLGDGILPDGDVGPLHLNLLHRRHPSLWVIGHFTTDAGAFPLLDLQAELAARVIAARRREPERARSFEAREAVARPDFSNGVRYKPVRRMADYVASRPYRRYLTRAIESLVPR